MTPFGAFLLLFSEKSGFKDLLIAHIICNDHLEFIFCLASNAIAKIMGDGIVLIFILHQYEFAVYSSAVTLDS